MSKRHSKDSGGHAHQPASKRNPPHKDWRAWVVVGLMLVAMVTYLLSFDESITPGEIDEGQQQPIDSP